MNHWDFHIAAKELIVPSLPSPNNVPSLAACLYLRKLFKKELDNDIQEKRIYIQRTSGRTISNEIEVLAILASFNFEIVRAEDLTVAVQAILFSKAKIVIGPHGSGFTNIVFCKPETIIVELFSPHWINPCFWVIANQINLIYAYQIGDSDGHSKIALNKGASMYIDIVKFKAILKNVWTN